ncbi:hypothetical protein KR044_008288 [Drosophila immigrans]|nr:hypothetical protein KR044_008288 [Drosophila immigrans]
MHVICHCLLALLALGANVSADISCKAEDNSDVDWWYIYTPDGSVYFYLTSENQDNWQASFHELRKDESLPSVTLNSLIHKEHLLIAAYNDVFPNGTKFDRGGSAKGWIATDRRKGVWVTHSMPQYPPMETKGYVDPHNPEHGRGHHFLCLSLDPAGIEKAADLLLLYKPHYYYIRDTLSPVSFPHLRHAIDQEWSMFGELEQDVELTTAKGKKFRVFGRHPESKKELYSDIISPALGIDLFVRTFHDTKVVSEKLPNKCNNNKVYNVNMIVNPLSYVLDSTVDHSKWAVSRKQGVKLFWLWRVGGSDWTCVGDLDRVQSHQNRGGGAICLEDSDVSERYRQFVYTYEECVCETFPCEGVKY